MQIVARRSAGRDERSDFFPDSKVFLACLWPLKTSA
jgi:hypothetical protein